MSFTEGMSAADLAAVTGNNDGFGGNGAWWIIILFLFAFCGGWGNGGLGGGVSENYTLVSDMGQIERKIDGVYSGICDSTYALNNAITGGFASAQSTMTQGFAGLNTGMVQQGYESRIATQNVGNTVQNCCCDLKSRLADINYNMANQANGINNAINTGFCQTNFNAQNNTRDIVDSQNASTQAILSAIQSIKDDAKDQKIADQAAQISALQLAASQQAQNNYIISKLQPVPVPAFPASNLYNYNNSCGCSCGNI